MEWSSDCDIYADLKYLSRDRQSPETWDGQSTGSQQWETQGISHDNLVCKAPEKSQGCSDWRLMGGLFFILLLMGATFYLLAAYLQVHSLVHMSQVELDELLLNQSHWLEELEKEEANVMLLRGNLSSLQGQYQFLQEHLLALLLHNQSLQLQERHRIQGQIWDIDKKHGALWEEYDLLAKGHIPIPQQSEMLQNCLETADGTERKVCHFCPPGWRISGVWCYFLHLDSQNWESSLKRCQTQGGHLAVITSLEEQNFVKLMVKDVSWLGLSDRDREGDWRWADGTPYNSAPKFWQGKQPDNIGNEDCVTLSPRSDWNDDKCRKLYNSVCERKVSRLFLQGGILSN
ncbi:asialoglycoprotein receptor 1-like [Xenopus laevis]|uniref:Asialoglycoprotein receptor 1-like n=1 Tax=Xenopus laevis TaxID=8355 RepID=A0A8J1L9C0_XENLA|nr:asialoglycoprotein receptor 1-like [Xenopus laevis]